VGSEAYVPHENPVETASVLFVTSAALLRRWPVLAGGAVVAALIAYAGSYLITPTYTARTSFISPQPQQNSAAAALASISALSGLAGAGAAARSPADQYVALMQSATLSDRMIERFSLDQLYEVKYRTDARQDLARNVRITPGKKDNLIVVEVDDADAKRAADMANAYVDELKKLSNSLALTEAQQRRSFFEEQLAKAKNSLTDAQTSLQRTGFNAGALKSEPKAAAEAFARIKAEIAATEVQIGALSKSMTESAPEMQRARATLAALRSQLASQEQPLAARGDQDYVGAYREFKYQEALFDIYARQFELAKLDEAREGAVIQVLDKAAPPERRSKPRRLVVGFLGGLAGLALMAIMLLWRQRSPRAAGGSAA
jgi:uncharacterized protein involved in exopolysaccharide biosynthesis